MTWPKPLQPLREALVFLGTGKIIEKQVKKDNNIIYGARAAKKQIGFVARPTQDYDILSPRPRRSARKLERNLDKQAGRDIYYMKPAMHPGTFKVKSKGFDGKKNTPDDKEVADFTKPNRKYKTKTIEGIRYVTLAEIKKDKRTALADKQFAFRHAKDQEDLDRIKLAKEMGIRYRR